MFKNITNFIKYHNAFIIVIMFIFLASFSALAANENLRDKVLGEKIVTESGIDNSALLEADLDNFDLEMKILDVREDEDNYYIVYQFQILEIRENVWQIILRQKELEISKEALAGQDLGLYVAEELGEVIDYKLAYLKEVQENENKKGDSKITQETKYEGLLGLIISTKTKKLPLEYELVVKPPVIEEQNSSTQESGSSDDYNSGEIDIPDDNAYYQKLEELCEENNLYWYNNVCNDDEEIAIPDSVCDSNHLDLCDTEELCKEINLFWYNDVCNNNPKEEPVCDLENLNLCDTEELCEEINLFWYDNVCNVEERLQESPEEEPVCDLENLNLCDTEELCEEINLFWYDDVCNAEEQLQESPEEEPATKELI